MTRFEIAQDTYNLGFEHTGNAMMLAALELEDLSVKSTSKERSDFNDVLVAKAGMSADKNFCHREDFDL